MAKNEGKKFEEDFRNSFPDDIFVYRIKDSSNFQQTTKNLCDFIIFHNKKLFLMELKSTKGNAFSFDERIIKGHQLNGLYTCEKTYSDVYGGFVFNYRGRVLKTKTVEPETYYISASDVMKAKKKYKTLHKDLARSIGIKIGAKKRISRYRYDTSFMEVIMTEKE